MTDNFDREVDAWLDDLEERLAPVGRHTAHVQHEPSDDGAPPSGSNALARSGDAGSGPGHDQQDAGLVGLERREAQLEADHRALVRTDALVVAMKELAKEVRSVRRDVDHIKAIIAKLRWLAETERRAGGRTPRVHTVDPATSGPS